MHGSMHGCNRAGVRSEKTDSSNPKMWAHPPTLTSNNVSQVACRRKSYTQVQQVGPHLDAGMLRGNMPQQIRYCSEGPSYVDHEAHPLPQKRFAPPSGNIILYSTLFFGNRSTIVVGTETRDPVNISLLKLQLPKTLDIILVL